MTWSNGRVRVPPLPAAISADEVTQLLEVVPDTIRDDGTGPSCLSSSSPADGGPR